MFQPYSGVKTSILILDKSLAKKADAIAFFKVENDGFGLGTQRREIDKNDLPQAEAEIAEYLRRLRAGESVDEFQPTLAPSWRRQRSRRMATTTSAGSGIGRALSQQHSLQLVPVVTFHEGKRSKTNQYQRNTPDEVFEL